MTGDMSILRSEYELKNSQYEKLCKEATTQLSELLHQEHITLAFPIDSRVKSWESVSGKCQRRDTIPATLAEVGDIAGLRIVLLFRRDQEKVRGIIQEHFEVLKVEDTIDRLSVDQFGYGSVHFQIRLKPEWLVLPVLSELRDLQAEIQVRTASQHIWAEASQFFQYKSKIHVPRPMLRTINRVAAILELVDLEFDRALTERETYIGEPSTFEEDQPLNTDVLEKILADEFPPENKTDGEPFGMLLDDFIAFGIDNVRSLKELLRKHRHAVFAAEEASVKDLRKKKVKGVYVSRRARGGVFYTHTGLARRALREEFGDEAVSAWIIKAHGQYKKA